MNRRRGLSRILQLTAALLPLSGGAATLVNQPAKPHLPAACAAPLRIATGGLGTPYNLVGEAFAQQIRLLLPACEVSVLATAGGVENLKLLSNGGADIVFANVAAAWEASVGAGAFTHAPVALRALAVTFPNTMHLVVRRDAGIKTAAGLRGKRLSTGAANSGTEAIALRMVEAAGLAPERDVQRFSMGLDESLRAIRAGRIDGFIFGGAVPVPSVGVLLQEGGYELVPHGSLRKTMTPLYAAVYREGQIAPDAYANQAGAVSSIDIWDMVIVSERLPASMAYLLTRVLFDQREALVRAHSSMRYLDLANQDKITTVSIHLGAAKYFAERGIAPFNRQMFGTQR